MIAASVMSFIHLHLLSVTFMGVKFIHFEAEIIATGVICFLGEF